MPWDALRTLMSQCIYGGKIDNEFDQRLLTSFVDKLFTKESFDSEFPLITSTEGSTIAMPDGIRYEVIQSRLSRLFVLIHRNSVFDVQNIGRNQIHENICCCIQGVMTLCLPVIAVSVIAG